MTNLAMRIRGVSKRYRLGHFESPLATWLRPLARARGRRDVGDDGPVPARKPGHVWALKDVSFDVHAGEVVGVIGKNGSGKSTLLKILSRITTPTEGEVEMYGRLGSLLEVGAGFHPELTGRENVFLNGTLIGMTRKEILRHLDEIVAFAEIEKFLDTPVKRYSSGMYVRLAFAVAAHLDTDVLVLDEVLSVGDQGYTRKCLKKIRDITRSGRTCLVVSHNMAVIQNTCTRVVQIDQGRLVFDGPVVEGIHAYAGGVLATPLAQPAPGPRPQGTKVAGRRATVRAIDNEGNVRASFEVPEPFTLEFEYEEVQGAS